MAAQQSQQLALETLGRVDLLGHKTFEKLNSLTRPYELRQALEDKTTLLSYINDLEQHFLQNGWHVLQQPRLNEDHEVQLEQAIKDVSNEVAEVNYEVQTVRRNADSASRLLDNYVVSIDRNDERLTGKKRKRS